MGKVIVVNFMRSQEQPAKTERRLAHRRPELLERRMDKVFLDSCALYERSKKLLRMAEKGEVR